MTKMNLKTENFKPNVNTVLNISVANIRIIGLNLQLIFV